MASADEQSTGVAPELDATLRRLALAGVVGPLLFWAGVVVLGLVTPGYSAVSDYISTLGTVQARYGVVQRANFVVFGASTIAFAGGLDRWSRDGGRPWLGVVLVGVLGLGIAGAGVFPDDRANPESTTAMLHGLVTLVGFLAASVGLPLTTWRLDRHERWPDYGIRFPVATVVVAGGVAVAVFLASFDTGWAGLGQRVLALVPTVWVTYHSFWLYQVAAGDAGTS